VEWYYSHAPRLLHWFTICPPPRPRALSVQDEDQDNVQQGPNSLTCVLSETIFDKRSRMGSGEHQSIGTGEGDPWPLVLCVAARKGLGPASI